MTPRRFTNIMEGRRQAAEAREQAAVAGAWYGEALARTKRLPPLDGLLTRGDAVDQTPEDMLAVMKVIQAGGGDMTIEVVDIGDL